MTIGNLNGISNIQFQLLENRQTNPIRMPQNKDGVADFIAYLGEAMTQLNQMQQTSQKLDEDLALGKTDNIHQVMVQAEKAGVALQFALQVRNKALDAYNEIMRMQF